MKIKKRMRERERESSSDSPTGILVFLVDSKWEKNCFQNVLVFEKETSKNSRLSRK